MRVRTMRDVAATIRGRRVELGMSQVELARRCSVSRKWVIDVEAGKSRVELGLVLGLLDALDLAMRLDTAGMRGSGPQVDLDAVVDQEPS